jgi:DNA-binding transcriptional ArsR family regulator
MRHHDRKGDADMALEADTAEQEFGCATANADGEIMLDDMVTKAQAAAAFLKALAHEGRLMILCHLSQGEKSVTELEQLLCARQAAVSQQLARLRLEGMVTARRDGKTIYYSLSDPKSRRLIELVYDLFCGAPEGQTPR